MKEQFEKYLLGAGWDKDRWGHFQKTRVSDGEKLRYHFGKWGARKQIKGGCAWIGVRPRKTYRYFVETLRRKGLLV